MRDCDHYTPFPPQYFGPETAQGTLLFPNWNDSNSADFNKQCLTVAHVGNPSEELTYVNAKHLSVVWHHS